eukprot:scaffold20704_cov129-Isochrysis_galbana.AAC.5
MPRLPSALVLDGAKRTGGLWIGHWTPLCALTPLTPLTPYRPSSSPQPSHEPMLTMLSRPWVIAAPRPRHAHVRPLY